MDEQKVKSTDTTIKISRATKGKWDEIYNESGFANQSMFMDELLERYYYPIKQSKELEVANKQLEESAHQISKLQDEIKTMKANIEAAQKLAAEKEAECETLSAKIVELSNDNIRNIEELNSSFSTKSAEQMKGHILVPISPLDRKCLEWMTERERKERGRKDITPEVFFMYVVKEMLINGNKFSVKCVPDKVIKQLEAQLKAEAEKESKDE